MTIQMFTLSTIVGFYNEMKKNERNHLFFFELYVDYTML